MTVTDRSLTGHARNPLIIVEPRGQSWIVRSARRRNGVAFQSAWQAEEAARKVGRKFADVGVSSEIQLFIRGGEYVGSLTYLSRVGLID